MRTRGNCVGNHGTSSEKRSIRFVSVSVAALFMMSALSVVAMGSLGGATWWGALPDANYTDHYVPDDPYIEGRTVASSGNAEIILGAKMLQTAYTEDDPDPDYYLSTIKPMITVNTLGTVDYTVKYDFTGGPVNIPSSQTTTPDLRGDGWRVIQFPLVQPYNERFTFPYFGYEYDRFYLSENGYITLGQTQNYSLSSGQTTFPDSSFAPNGVIAPFWAALSSSGSDITCGYSNEPWGEMYTYSIRWNKIGSAGGQQTFMLSLRQDGAIIIDYGNLNTVAHSSGYENIIGSKGGTLSAAEVVDYSTLIIYPTPGSYQYIDQVKLQIDKTYIDANGNEVRDVSGAGVGGAGVEFTNLYAAHPWKIPSYNIWTFTPFAEEENPDPDLDPLIAWGLNLAEKIPKVGRYVPVLGYLYDYYDLVKACQDDYVPESSSFANSTASTNDVAWMNAYACDWAALPTGYARPPPHTFHCMSTIEWRINDNTRTYTHFLKLKLFVTVHDSSAYNPLDPSAAYDSTLPVYQGMELVFTFYKGNPHMTVISPNGGESYTPRSTCPITWTADLGTGPKVNIDLYKGGVYHSSIASSIGNSGSYSWTLPSDVPAGTDYTIRVSSKWMEEHEPLPGGTYTSGPVCDFSDRYFTILRNPGPQLTVRAIDMNRGGIADSCSVDLGHWPWVGPDIAQNLQNDVVQLDGSTGVIARAYHSNYWDFDHWEYKGTTYATEPWPHDTYFYVYEDCVLTAYFVSIEWVMLWAGLDGTGGGYDPNEWGTTNPAPMYDWVGYEYGTVVTYTAIPTSPSKFAYWEYRTGTVTQKYYDYTAPYTFTTTVIEDFIVTACFTPKVDLFIDVSPSGGGTTSPSVGTYTDYKYMWESATVTAIPTQGYVFDHWIYMPFGNVQYTLYENPVTITLECPWVNCLTAYFKAAFTSPGVPVNVVATSGQRSIWISWSAPSDGGSPITEYYIYRDGARIATIPGSARPYEDWNVTLGSTHSYQVQADNRAGEGPSSTPVSCTSTDTTPPTTSITLAGTAGSNGWYKSSVTVTLTAADGHGTGVNSIKYRVDGGTLKTYSSPFSVSGDKVHTVEYYSTDRNNNVELTKSTAVKIDVTKPSTTCTLTGTKDRKTGQYTTPVTVKLSATDGTTGSGVAQIWYKLDGLAWTPYTGQFMVSESGGHTVYYYAIDNAGNVEAQKQTSFIIKTGAIPV